MVYTNIQRLTLEDIFRTAGLEEYQIIDILNLLKTKPSKVQMAFYYRACGMTYKEIGVELDISKQYANRIITSQCKEIKKYLKNHI